MGSNSRPLKAGLVLVTSLATGIPIGLGHGLQRLDTGPAIAAACARAPLAKEKPGSDEEGVRKDNRGPVKAHRSFTNPRQRFVACQRR